MDLAIDVQLADAPGDELGVLRSEVHDEDALGGRRGRGESKVVSNPESGRPSEPSERDRLGA